MSIAMEELADRLRQLLGPRPGLAEKKMFGGRVFMLNGNMLMGAMGNGALLARHAPGEREIALGRPGAAPMEMGARTMSGFVTVTDDGIDSDEALADWIAYAESYVRTLPPK